MFKRRYIFLFSILVLVFCVFFLNAPHKKTIEMYLQNFEKQKYIIGINNDVYSIYPSENEEQIKILKPQLKEILSYSGIFDINSYAPEIKINSTDFFINFQEDKTIINRKLNGTNQWIQYSRAPIRQDVITAKYLKETYHNKKRERLSK